MMHEPYDDLDLAIAALPLEAAPAGLRASILQRTVYRNDAPVWTWDIVLLGACFAMLVWATLAILTGAAAPILHTINSLVPVALAQLTNLTTLSWIATGMVLAFFLASGTTPQPPQRIATRR